MKISTIALAAALLGATALTQAQAQMPNRYDHIRGREFHQQQRIHAGLRDGQLSRRQAVGLERGEHRINREVHTMRAHDNGHLTMHDRRTIYHQQNRLSHRIYRDRHF